jgi:hypothetical protein
MNNKYDRSSDRRFNMKGRIRWKKYEDIVKDEKPYPVYRNDIKHKKFTKINTEKAIWMENDLESEFMNTDTDSLKYRLNQSEKEDFDNVDLNYMKKTDIEAFFMCEFFRKHKGKIKHLFMECSEIERLPDLSLMTSLETLNINNNSVSILRDLPKSLIELEADHNDLTILEGNFENIKRMNVSNNKLTSIGKLDMVVTLNISNNKIVNMYREYRKLDHLNCRNNPLVDLPIMPVVDTLDCSLTSVTVVKNHDKLSNLTCNNSNVESVSNLPLIKTIEVINGNIKNIPYFSTLRNVLFHKGNKISISSKYDVKGSLEVGKDIYEILLNTPNPLNK